MGYFVQVGCHEMWQIFPESSFLILKYDFEAVKYYKGRAALNIFSKPVYLHNTYFAMQLANHTQLNNEEDKHYLAI